MRVSRMVRPCPKFRLKWPNFVYKSSKVVSNFSPKSYLDRDISDGLGHRACDVEEHAGLGGDPLLVARGLGVVEEVVQLLLLLVKEKLVRLKWR